jgi:hypothetical protein
MSTSGWTSWRSTKTCRATCCNPFAGFAKARAAGSHEKPTASKRLEDKRVLKKLPLAAEDD